MVTRKAAPQQMSVPAIRASTHSRALKGSVRLTAVMCCLWQKYDPDGQSIAPESPLFRCQTHAYHFLSVHGEERKVRTLRVKECKAKNTLHK